MSIINRPQIIVIIGPTASGKSDLALQLARLVQGKAFKKVGINGAEIISADSRQVYRGMDIGTGKVLKDKTFPVPNSKFKNQNSKLKKQSAINNKQSGYYSEGIRHHLLDVASPKKTFTVDQYKKLGEKAIKEILAKNKIPIIVGGTGFYIDVLLGRISFAEVPPNKKLRAKLEKQSTEQLFKQLKNLDPERAKTIDPKNKRRLIRALEIIISTGKPVPQTCDFYHDRGKNHMSLNYDILWLGVKRPQKELEKRIKIRLDQRLDEGMITEVQNLLKSGVSYRRLFDFGLEYRQISEWLKTQSAKRPDFIADSRLRSNRSKASRFYRGLAIAKQSEQSVKEFKKSFYYEKLLREIIKYSKRQMTWFKRNSDIKWLNPNSKNYSKQSEKLTEKFLENF